MKFENRGYLAVYKEEIFLINIYYNYKNIWKQRNKMKLDTNSHTKDEN